MGFTEKEQFVLNNLIKQKEAIITKYDNAGIDLSPEDKQELFSIDEQIIAIDPYFFDTEPEEEETTTEVTE